ncbi:hypothetical protein [Pseudomonas arsenicoxydans]|uniref:Uncharacterized protein n=1 Tax=Pseudomonas arsenicoxydans TaxID=702115 RepID=A0A502HXP2_9PSED|nr:hypothetical protein [Pseudomonas arsenicoxydans]TPG78514.1 hypothetical protein EAH78_13210 [Pseudomonas arsenicoxydans]
MKPSAICFAGSVLFSVGASATGILPLFDLDFTRSADQTLKKLNINDACIVAAPAAVAFTYCREGSTTLWKYQAVDLEQQAAIHVGARQPQMALGQISVLEVNSAACLQEMEPDTKPPLVSWAVLGLVVLFLLIGLRYTYNVIRHHYDQRSALSDPFWQPPIEPLPPAHHAMGMALGAFAVAALLAIVYCCCAVI